MSLPIFSLYLEHLQQGRYSYETDEAVWDEAGDDLELARFLYAKDSDITCGRCRRVFTLRTLFSKECKVKLHVRGAYSEVLGRWMCCYGPINSMGCVSSCHMPYSMNPTDLQNSVYSEEESKLENYKKHIDTIAEKFKYRQSDRDCVFLFSLGEYLCQKDAAIKRLKGMCKKNGIQFKDAYPVWRKITKLDGSSGNEEMRVSDTDKDLNDISLYLGCLMGDLFI